jgi:hypothetical protein
MTIQTAKPKIKHDGTKRWIVKNNIGYLNAKANATKTPLIPNRLKRQIPAEKRFHSLHTSSPSRSANPYSNEDISNRYTFSTHS